MEKETDSVATSWYLVENPPEYYYYVKNMVGKDEALTKNSVNTIMSNITGIFSQDQATKFAINVIHEKNLDEYKENLLIPSTEDFYLTLRYMI